jgi:hypothetical protein
VLLALVRSFGVSLSLLIVFRLGARGMMMLHPIIVSMEISGQR